MSQPVSKPISKSISKPISRSFPPLLQQQQPQPDIDNQGVIGEYQLRREINDDKSNGDFYIVHTYSTNDQNEIRVNGTTIEEQIKNCDKTIKPVPLQLLLWAERVNKFYHRRKLQLQSNPDLFKIPLHLIDVSNSPPYPYQIKALQALFENKRKILALEMGLGKTFVTITFLRILKAMMLVDQQQREEEKKEEAIKNQQRQHQQDPNNKEHQEPPSSSSSSSSSQKIKLKEFKKQLYLYSLIIVPSSLIGQWKTQLNKYAPELSVKSIKDGKSAAFTDDVDIRLMSVGLLKTKEIIHKIKTTLPNRKFSLVAVDECHSMKHYKSQRSKGMYDISCKTERLHLIGGTPAMTHETTFGLLHLLHDIFKEFHHENPYPSKQQQQEEEEILYFGLRYCYPKKYSLKNGHITWSYTIDARKRELEAIMTEYRIRMTKEECLPDLPPVTESIIEIGELTSIQKKQFEHLLTIMKATKDHDLKNVLLFRIMDFTLDIKIPYVLEFIEKILNKTNEQFAIFVHHLKMSNAIIEKLDSLDIGYININSSIEINKRSGLIDSFQACKNNLNNKMRVCILSYGCVSTGIDNLTGIDLCLFVDEVYDAISVSQAKSRFCRIGQIRPVKLIFVHLKDSSDSMIRSNFLRKVKSNETILGKSLYNKEEDNSTFHLENFIANEDNDNKRRLPKRRKTVLELKQEIVRNGYGSEEEEEHDENDDNIIVTGCEKKMKKKVG